MVLTTQEKSLISVVRALPLDEAAKVLDWARHLADLGAGRPVDWSDAWTDEDRADAARSSFSHFADLEREGD